MDTAALDTLAFGAVRLPGWIRWLSHWGQRSHQRSQSRRNGRYRIQLSVEQLENRTLLSSPPSSPLAVSAVMPPTSTQPISAVQETDVDQGSTDFYMSVINASTVPPFETTNAPVQSSPGQVGQPLIAQSVVTYRNGDSAGIYPEATLTPTNVGGLQQQAFVKVDGQIYGQPIVVNNRFFVATENNSVYEFDTSGNLIASTSLNISDIAGAAVHAVKDSDVNGVGQISPIIGITSTMYYDKNTGYLYVVPYTEVVTPRRDASLPNIGCGVLDTAGNQLTLHSSLKIADTSVSGSVYTFYAGTPIVPGTGDGAVIGSDGSSTVYFNAQKELQRPALTVGPDGTIYLGFGGHDDTRPYHGWILGITGGADDLKVSYVLCTTPNGYAAGLWNTGAPFTILPNGDIFIQTGNGDFGDANSEGTLNAAGLPANGDYGDSVVLLSPSLQVISFFTPSNQQILNSNDLDLSDTQPILFEGHYLVTVGKEGTIYLLDTNNLGGYNPNGDQIVGELADVIPKTSQGAVWSEPLLYPVLTREGARIPPLHRGRQQPGQDDW